MIGAQKTFERINKWMNGYIEFLLMMNQHSLKAAQCSVWGSKRIPATTTSNNNSAQ